MPWSSLFQSVERLSAEQGLEDWYARLLTRLGDTPQPFELALVGGLLAATPGLAFLAGYQAALRMLWPAAPWTAGALCVTENRSTRPADMNTRIDGLQITGRKDFVTAAECAGWLLVAAREEDEGQAPRLALGVVRQGAPGGRIEPRLQALLAGCAEVARQAPDAPTTHLLLAGLFAEQQALAVELKVAFAGGPVHWAELWQRDKGLLRIAEAARSKRLEKARRIVAGR
ncbi:acyl-CoA dehydrogenase [Pseudomonas sp. 1-7]|nr:acyl-CoA dehydrogenase [Pseudomonas sp. 1-7]